MRDKYLVGVVSLSAIVIFVFLMKSLVQPKTRKYAWCQELCYGFMRGYTSFYSVNRCSRLPIIIQATSKDGKDAGIELIQPPSGSKPGDRVYFEGEKYESKYAST